MLDWRGYLGIGGTELGLDGQESSRKPWKNGCFQSSWHRQRHRAGGCEGTSDSRVWVAGGWTGGVLASSSDNRKLQRAEPWELRDVRHSQISCILLPPGRIHQGRKTPASSSAWFSPSLHGGGLGWVGLFQTHSVLLPGTHFPGIWAVMESSAWKSSGKRKDRMS